MPLRILLAVLVALACPTSQAWATGPQFGPMSGGGSGVVANTCTAGDFFSAVDGSGNFTCSTPSGSGDVTAVGDCTGPACFEGTTGNSLQFEGATANGFETTLTATDPTADRTATLPNFSGTLAMERVYDVRAYGAKCDDSTNDTTAIQAAIDAAEASGQGGIVQLPAGVCIVTALTLDEPGISIRGQGAAISQNASTLQCNITTGTCVTLGSSCSYCGLQDLILSTRNAPTDAVLIDGSAAAGDFVRQVNSVGERYCVGLKNIRVIDGVSMFTPVAGASCRAVSIVDNAVFGRHVLANLSTNVEGAIVIEQTGAGQVDTVVLSDVEIATSGGTGAALKIIGTSAVNPPRWIQISNSLFEGKTTGAAAGDYAIQIGNVREFKCTNCYAHGGYNAVRISGGPGPIKFVNSEIGDSQQHAFYHDADVPTELIGTTVSDGGQSSSNTYSGVYLTANSRQFTMIGGRASDDLFFSGSGQKYGIEIISGADEYRFSNVGCEGNDTACATGLTPAAAQAAFTDAVALADSDWSNYVLLRAPGTVSANWTLTLPDTDGTSGQFLQTDGSGVTTWATPSGSGNVSNTGTPVDNQLAIWTDATTIEGDAALTFDTSTNTLTTTTFSGALSGNATTATTAGAGDSATSFFSSGELERTLLPAASADCSSSNWAKGIDADLVLDCSQPAFSDLSGSATDAQIPNNITVDLATLATTATTANAGDSATSFFSSGELERTLLPAASGDCSSNQFAKGVDADFVLDCAQPDHGGLAGLSDDDHTQYALLAGRSGGQTLIGGTASGNDLTLQSTSHGTKGSIFVGSDWEFLDDIPDAVDSSTYTGAKWSPTLNITGTNFGNFSYTFALWSDPTVNLNDATADLGVGYYTGAVRGSGTYTRSTSTTYAGNFYLFYADPLLTSATDGVPPPQGTTFFDQSTTRYSAASPATATGSGVISIWANPMIQNTGTGTYTSGDFTALWANPRVVETAGTLNVPTVTGLKVSTPAIGGTTPNITTALGIDIEKMTGATSNISFRNAGATVYTPTTQAITANSDTIQPAATTVCLTANSNYDLTSNPQIANGVEGQILYLWNCDSAADTIEINDTNGLQLTALFNMDAGDVIVLQYMTIAGASDWYEVSRTED